MSIKFNPKVIPVEMNGGPPLYVREMSWRERKAFEKQVGVDKSSDEKELNLFPETLILLTACNEDGSRLFSDEEMDAVMDLPTAVFWGLFKASNGLNAISDANVEKERKN